jgi:hypothetical protein
MSDIGRNYDVANWQIITYLIDVCVGYSSSFFPSVIMFSKETRENLCQNHSIVFGDLLFGLADISPG